MTGLHWLEEYFLRYVVLRLPRSPTEHQPVWPAHAEQHRQVEETRPIPPRQLRWTLGEHYMFLKGGDSDVDSVVKIFVHWPDGGNLIEVSSQHSWGIKVLKMGSQNIWSVFLLILIKMNLFMPVLKKSYHYLRRYRKSSYKTTLNDKKFQILLF